VFDGTTPVLHDMQLPDPGLAAGQLLVDVHVCGVCRTDLHVIDRELAHPKQPVIPGHEMWNGCRAGRGRFRFVHKFRHQQ